jgi:ferric-dicitrate binding protein FerR (iron transport regulator)
MGFEDAPLAIVAAKANAIGGPKIEVPDAKVAGLRLTGVLDLRDTRALARKLAATFDLRVEERHGAILLRRRTP